MEHTTNLRDLLDLGPGKSTLLTHLQLAKFLHTCKPLNPLLVPTGSDDSHTGRLGPQKENGSLINAKAVRDALQDGLEGPAGGRVAEDGCEGTVGGREDVVLRVDVEDGLEVGQDESVIARKEVNIRFNSSGPVAGG